MLHLLVRVLHDRLKSACKRKGESSIDRNGCNDRYTSMLDVSSIRYDRYPRVALLMY